MRPKASKSRVAGISESLFSKSLSSVPVKRLKVLGNTPASCGLCFSTSRMAAFTLAPMSAASGRVSRKSKRASGAR